MCVYTHHCSFLINIHRYNYPVNACRTQDSSCTFVLRCSIVLNSEHSKHKRLLHFKG